MGHREDLLAGAKRLLATKGFGHITARDIVAESGTNLGSIGYHFGSKDALLNAAVLDSFNDWDGEVEKALAARTGDTPLDRLEAFLAAVIEGVQNNRPLAVASVHAFAQFEYVPELREQFAETYTDARRELASLALDRDDVDDATARRVGSLVLALINGLVMQWLIDRDAAPSAADMATAIRELVDPPPGE
ncbi:TetR/AcrR family transcriptional regulator [Haloactinopolyspora sp.]|uniref:TetR/AcrR family transcriptional regulator n=1 Tax=Haloactinopolyspora sp. TaxID=1966353 RepID=UPI0026359FD1|nr:TetR/AcrR family transcriptional regulator [Haloactinopolyspora sp.]